MNEFNEQLQNEDQWFEDHQSPKQEEKTDESTKHLYPLDWNDVEVDISKGRFSHTLKRPTNELLVERENEVSLEIPIAKDGSYGLPDPTVVEEIDAKFYERLKTEVKGYKDENNIPVAHKSAAFQGMFQSEIYVDEDCDVFGDEVVVIEEIGRGDEPDFVIKHFLRGATEKEVNSYRRKVNNGRLHPDKRQRQKFVQKSTLQTSMAFYSSLITRIEGVKVNNLPFTEAQRNLFINYVNAYSQREVIKKYIEELTGNLLD